jgi:hypothetical protein
MLFQNLHSGEAFQRKCGGDGGLGGRLLALLDGIATADPIGGEIVGQHEHAQMSEAHIVESFKRGANVGAMRHGTASAIDDDVRSAWNFLRPPFEIVKTLGVGSGSVKDSAGNMRAVKERAKADANNHRTVRSGEFLEQLLGLDSLGGSPRISRRLCGMLRGANLRGDGSKINAR